jgi:hypothetical protein
MLDYLDQRNGSAPPVSGARLREKKQKPQVEKRNLGHPAESRKFRWIVR